MSVKETAQINRGFFNLPLDDLITGRELGFGDGRHGCMVYDGFFPAVLPDERPSKFYEIHSTYFELPAGKTLKPPMASIGLVIYSLSDIVINGTIDMKNRGHHETAASMPTFLEVYGQRFDLPVCGNTVNGGKSGNGGSAQNIMGSDYFGGTGNNSTSGNSAGCRFAGGWEYPACGEGATWDTKNNTGRKGSIVSLASELNRKSTGIVVLIARGKIVIRGKIDCSASQGIPAENGQLGFIDNSKGYSIINGGRGGGCAQPPSGGGAITLIAKQIDRSGGTLDVSGKTYINTAMGTDPRVTSTFTAMNGTTCQAESGTGGTGTPAAGYTSQAGNIKEYIYI